MSRFALASAALLAVSVLGPAGPAVAQTEEQMAQQGMEDGYDARRPGYRPPPPGWERPAPDWDRRPPPPPDWGYRQPPSPPGYIDPGPGCRFVQRREWDGRIVTLRECRVCRPAVGVDAYGNRYRTEDCRAVLRPAYQSP